MTALESHKHRIDRAASLEALSDIARDIHAMQKAEHASAEDRKVVTEAVMAKTQRLAAALMAGNAMAKPPIQMQRKGQRLEPVDQWSAEQLEKLPAGVDLNVTATKARSHRQNGFYWVGLGQAVDSFDDAMRDRYPTSVKLHKAFLVALGFAETVWTFEGHPLLQADSTAFDNMSVDDFNAYFTRVQEKAADWLGWNPWAVARRSAAA